MFFFSVQMSKLNAIEYLLFYFSRVHACLYFDLNDEKRPERIFLFVERIKKKYSKLAGIFLSLNL